LQTLEQVIGEPPSVAGWPAYYQTPVYHKMWLNSVTMTQRMLYSDTVSNGVGVSRGGVSIVIKPLDFVVQFSSVANATNLINELCEYIYSVELTNKQKDYLKSQLLLNNMYEYQWTELVELYQQNPNDQVTAGILKKNLNNLFQKIMALAEYQLK